VKKIELNMEQEQGVIWARVSTKEQSEEGYSLDSQIKLLREYAKQNNIRIVKEFIVPESASGRQERKKFKEFLGYIDCKPKVTQILCEKVDRVTRNFKDAIRLDDWINDSSKS